MAEVKVVVKVLEWYAARQLLKKYYNAILYLKSLKRNTNDLEPKTNAYPNFSPVVV